MIQPLIHITRKQALAFAAWLVIYEFLTYIANDLIMPGMLSVVNTFHAEESNVATSLSAYIIGGASLQLILGPVSDRFGRRPVMLIGCAFFTAVTLLIPWSQNIHQFLWYRFFEGMGLCYLNVVGYALLQEIFSESDAIRVIAIMANVSILAPLLGPLAGSAFLQYGDWKDMFYLVGILAALSLWGLWRYMPESIGQTKRDGQMIPRGSLSFVAILQNYKRLIQHKTFLFGTLAYGLMGIVCCVWIALSPVILVTDAKMSLLMYGIWQIPVFGAFIAGNVVLSFLSYRYTALHLALVGSIILFVGLLGMWLLPYIYGVHPIWLMPGLVVYSFGFGMAVTALNRFILFVTQVGTGTTSALVSTSASCAAAIGIEIANYLFVDNDNLVIAQFSGWIGIAYIICVLLCVKYHKHEKKLGIKNL